MDFQTHNDIDVNINMSHLQGYVDANWDELVALFGEPEYLMDKVDWEWSIQFEDGTVATVYNWKNGPSYGGYAMPDRIKTWHIGGFNPHAHTLVNKVLSDYRQGNVFPVPDTDWSGRV